MENKRTVYVAHAHERKDLKAAEQFGRLTDVFSAVGRSYNTHARRMLSNWQPGDSILMIGDPALCGICIAVASEFDNVITTLSWDRNEFVYIPRRWDFSPEARGVDSAA